MVFNTDPSRWPFTKITINFKNMFCTDCGKSLEKDSVFCEFCGAKQAEAGPTTEPGASISDQVMSLKGESPINASKEILNKELKQMADHLEFLGYGIEKLETSGDDKRENVFAQHPSNLDFTLLEVFPGFIILKVLMATKKKPSSEIDAFINDMNKNFIISKIYREIENETVYLRIESIYMGVYVKDLFVKFMDLNIRDHNQLRSSDDFTNLFVN